MESKNAHSHLTLEERRIILIGIQNSPTKTAIAKTIGKDKSTVGKEIKAHRILVKKCPMSLECASYRKCVFDRQSPTTVRTRSPSTARAVTLPQAPVMAAQTAADAASTNMNITRKKPMLSTMKLW